MVADFHAALSYARLKSFSFNSVWSHQLVLLGKDSVNATNLLYSRATRVNSSELLTNNYSSFRVFLRVF